MKRALNTLASLDNPYDITRDGLGKPIPDLFAAYMSVYRIFQTRDHVAMTFEWSQVFRLIYTNGSRNNIPTCGAGQPQRFAFDSTTPAGKSQLAGIRSAKEGRRVEIKEILS